MMFKLFCCLTFLFGGAMNTNSLFNNIAETSQIVVFNQGSTFTFNRGDDKFEMILNAFLNTIKNAREMPAFGVSLHDETTSALKLGTWIEFVFDRPQSHNDMPFESLLVSVEPDHTGINLIRKQNGKFDGRCFYLDLSTNLKVLHSLILEICA